MKNVLKMTGVIALALVIGITLVACSGGGGGGSKLSGTYVNDDMDISYTFSGNKITAKMGDAVLSEGTFAVKNGKLALTNEDGTEELDYSLVGNELKITRGGYEMLFVKK